jgi:DEAD/DEAH box helicase domain-containing protein
VRYGRRERLDPGFPVHPGEAPRVWSLRGVWRWFAGNTLSSIRTRCFRRLAHSSFRLVPNSMVIWRPSVPAQAKLIKELLKKCGAWSGAGISSVTYQDPYVCSPLVARLLIDTVGSLVLASRSELGTLIIETRSPRGDDNRSDPWQLGHDWRTESDQKSVIELLGKQNRMEVSVYLKGVPHGRFMTIDFTTGERATIVLDQGFGAWAPPRHVRLRHDFEADPGAQAKRLATVNVILQRSGFGSTYMVAAPAE